MKKELEKYERYLYQNYRKKNTRNNYHRFVRYFLTWLYNTQGKTVDTLTLDDTKDYKAYCLQKYKPNSNVGILNALNNFVDEHLGKPELRVTAPASEPVDKDILSEKELERFIKAAKNPMDHLIAIYIIEGLLRPSDFVGMKISHHNLESQKLYTPDSKSGNKHIIITPRMKDAFKRYLAYRVKPKDPKDNDYLIIISKGSHCGNPVKNRSFIYRHVKTIASNAGFNKSVYPYSLKPSSITNQLNEGTNPRIVQQQARHKDIETTMLYNHVTDEMVKAHYNKIQGQSDISHLTPEQKSQRLYDLYIEGKIDKRQLDMGLKSYNPEYRRGENLGYA